MSQAQARHGHITNRAASSRSSAYATTDFFPSAHNQWSCGSGKEFLEGWFERQVLFVATSIIRPESTSIPCQPNFTGSNTILVKVCQNEQTEQWTNEWEFQLRVTDSLGTPLVSTRGSSAAEASEKSRGNATIN